jgi:hypothetical protein
MVDDSAITIVTDRMEMSGYRCWKTTLMGKPTVRLENPAGMRLDLTKTRPGRVFDDR